MLLRCGLCRYFHPTRSVRAECVYFAQRTNMSIHLFTYSFIEFLLAKYLKTNKPTRLLEGIDLT